MREIKFRAWAERGGGPWYPNPEDEPEEAKKKREEYIMFYGVERAYDTLGHMEDGDGNNVEYTWDSFNEILDLARAGELPLMQYTGLKDKNGKEVWEGDIVRKTIRDRDGKLHKFIEAIKWSKQRLAWYSDIAPLSTLYDYEVIGNIYENPELLEEK